MPQVDMSTLKQALEQSFTSNTSNVAVIVASLPGEKNKLILLKLAFDIDVDYVDILIDNENVSIMTVGVFLKQYLINTY